MSVAESHELISRSTSLVDRIRDGLPSYWQDFREDPRWLLMFVLARILPVRNLLWSRPSAVAAHGSLGGLFDFEVGQACADLRTRGIHQGLRLPEAVADDIRRFADETPCFANHDRNADALPAVHLERSRADRPITSGHYFERIDGCPAIAMVRDDPKLSAVAAAYLGPNAQIIATRLWWSFPLPQGAPVAATAREREMLHFDLDDWRMMKVFFYLTPVDPSTGPHLFINGSHLRRTFRHQFSITVGHPIDDVVRYYGPDKLIEICGPAGSGFIEDPFGFHAGSLASHGPRLMLEIAFGVSRPNRRRFFGEKVGATRPHGAAPALTAA